MIRIIISLDIFSLLCVLLEIWRETEGELDAFETGDGYVDANIPAHSSESILLKLLTLFLLRLQGKYYISDSAIECLLKFCSLFVIIGQFSEVGKNIAEHMPKSVYSLRKFIGINDQFEKLIVCTNCNSVYNIKDCIERQDVSKRCEYTEFSHSRKCQFLLLKTVELASRKKILYPFKTYCYQNIKSSLQRLYHQPNFHNLCEEWRTRNVPSGLGDVYDGRIWRDFQFVSEKPFLASKFNLAFWTGSSHNILIPSHL